MNNDIKSNFIALKSLVKEIEKDLKEQMKVEDKVPEEKTETLSDLLEFVKKETEKRPLTSKPGKVEKGKKSSKKDVKKAVEEIQLLLNEITVAKAASDNEMGDSDFEEGDEGVATESENVAGAENIDSDGSTDEETEEEQ